MQIALRDEIAGRIIKREMVLDGKYYEGLTKQPQPSKKFI
jgi:hypothetical protein